MAPDSLRTSAIILAAGSGSRMGRDLNKIFLDLGGITILEHSLRLFKRLAHEIVLVVAAADRHLFEGRFKKILEESPETRLVDGGARRADSSRAGIEACDPGSELILIHDAARPFPPLQSIEAALECAAAAGAAILAVPVGDTLKKAPDGKKIEATLSRDGLYRAQTPQVFQRKILVDALEKCGGSDFTDDAAMLEAAGHPVALVHGHEHNIKITTDQDLILARAILQKSRGDKR